MTRKNYQVEQLEHENKILREQISSMRKDPGEMPVSGCGDNSCIVQKPQGMATNGGCRCDERTLRRAVMWHNHRENYLVECVRQAKQSLNETESRALETEMKLWNLEQEILNEIKH